MRRASRRDVQDLVDRLVVRKLSPNTIQVTLMPLRAIYRRAVARGEVAINPTAGPERPAVGGRPRSHRLTRGGGQAPGGPVG